MWDPPGTGMKALSPVFVGRFFNIEPLGKPQRIFKCGNKSAVIEYNQEKCGEKYFSKYWLVLEVVSGPFVGTFNSI